MTEQYQTLHTWQHLGSTYKLVLTENSVHVVMKKSDHNDAWLPITPSPYIPAMISGIVSAINEKADAKLP